MTAERLLALLGELGVTAVVAVGFAWAAFRWLGARWIEGKFAERLEAFKHAQEREIEELRFRINALLDRKTKLHQFEFEVLPKVWDHLATYYGEVTGFTARLQSYPRLDEMPEQQVAHFLGRTPLVEWQRNEITAANRGSRSGLYQKHIWEHDVRDVQDAHREFTNYFITRGIFIQPHIRERMKEIANMMHDAWYERVLDRDHGVPGPGRYAKGDKFRECGPRLMAEVEALVQARLWDAELSDKAS